MSFDIDSPITVEHIELGIDLRHTRIGDLIITLTSPNGTVSTLMDRPTVNDERPFGCQESIVVFRRIYCGISRVCSSGAKRRRGHGQ